MGDTWHDMVVSEDVEKREVSYHMSTFSFWNFRFVQIFIVFFVVFCFFFQTFHFGINFGGCSLSVLDQYQESY